MKWLLLSLLASAGLIACAPSDAAPTLCELAEARERYADQTVTVEGYLIASGHGNSISDPRCGYGVGLTWHQEDVPRLRHLDAIANRAQREPLMVRLKVSGRMKQDDANNMLGVRAWRLALFEAEVLSAQRLSEADAHRYLTWLEGPSPEPFRPSR